MTDSLAKLRRELVAQSADHLSVSDDYKGGRTVTDLAAHRGSLMAGTYAYVLAAVLGRVAKEFGPQAGVEYAEMVDFMLINGDDDDLNADVAEAAVKP
jgi:hypothetical protein